jgi:hypothetical protein
MPGHYQHRRKDRMSDLAHRHPAPDGRAQRLTDDQVDRLQQRLPSWSVAHGKLSREVEVKNFRAALDLVNAIGAVA